MLCQLSYERMSLHYHNLVEPVGVEPTNDHYREFGPLNLVQHLHA